jgi:hypothetical protein
VLEVHKKELSELNCRYAPATVREIVQWICLNTKILFKSYFENFLFEYVLHQTLQLYVAIFSLIIY